MPNRFVSPEWRGVYADLREEGWPRPRSFLLATGLWCVWPFRLAFPSRRRGRWTPRIPHPHWWRYFLDDEYVEPGGPPEWSRQCRLCGVTEFTGRRADELP